MTGVAPNAPADFALCRLLQQDRLGQSYDSGSRKRSTYVDCLLWGKIGAHSAYGRPESVHGDNHQENLSYHQPSLKERRLFKHVTI
jgi:hypothetical protein